MDESRAAAIVSALFGEHYAPLVRYARRRLENLESAEEVVQEALMGLYQNLRTGKEIQNPRAWVSCVVHRQVSHRLYDLRREAQALREWSQDRTPGVRDWVIDNLDFHRADPREIFDVLSKREEEVLFMRMAAMKYREIADELRISISSVNTLLARAVNKLRRAAQGKFFGDVNAIDGTESFPETLD